MLIFERWKIILVLCVVGLGVCYTIPNFFAQKSTESVPGWFPHKQINLGLDLQGGSHLLLEVDVGVVLDEQLETLVDEVRIKLRAKGIGYTGLGRKGEQVVLTVANSPDLEEVAELLETISDEVLVQAKTDGAVILELTETARREKILATLSQSIEIVRRRVDETGTSEPTIQRQGDDRILVQLPGIDDPERIKRLLGKTAKLNFRMVDEATPAADALQGQIPSGSELLYDVDRTKGEGEPRPVVVRKRISVSGDNLVDAQPTFQDNQPVVSLRFDAVGARKFGALTRDNVGKRFAIVLDGAVISAPVIREPIPGGSGIISGNFTTETAQDLALLLRAGALPAPLTILEERTVGPSLGADSVAAGKVASMVGMGLVIIYIIASYGLFGVAAVLALTVNMVLIIGALSILQATLTLPGIAGIVLTIGMAVDANVLIFERIREEVRNGRSPFSSVDIGFRQAFRTIVDANVTTLIAAILLFQFGSGPVRGFSVTLAIGIMTSMFTAIMFTRMLIVLWLRQVRPQTLPI